MLLTDLSPCEAPARKWNHQDLDGKFAGTDTGESVSDEAAGYGPVKALFRVCILRIPGPGFQFLAPDTNEVGALGVKNSFSAIRASLVTS